MNGKIETAFVETDELIVKPAFGRLAASHIGEFLLKRGLRWQRILDVDRVDTVIVQAVISANLAYLPIRSAGLDVSNEQRRATSVLAVSSSMGLSYATVRNRMRSLGERGIMLPRGSGYVVPVNPMICGDPGSLAEQDFAAIQSLLNVMQSQGFQSLPKTSRTASSARVGRAIVEFAVRSLEGFAEQHGSITTGSIWASIIAANVRGLLSGAQLPDGYAQASQPLPDSERRPVSLRKIASEVNLPFETVRRHVATMVKRGSVDVDKRGVIVPARALTTPQQIARSRLNIGYLRRLFDSLDSV
ncbi:DNA-binding Lrp family transcriptional regulator [Sphingomonas sp. BE138]|uniref:hypothetical protein n=1 Tax=Sphingomonas sp. BE138 TaxID=2817845 RepID=UPI002863D218|nr:hypothetical protein [Sphingomonas sp. BE138]MDR6790269.1 DNA-binding Lrp family transcriptional regulator [Sphingomonas sp. BE138]